MNKIVKRVPVWFWVVSVIALLWFLLDASGYYMRVLAGDDMLMMMSEEQRMHIHSIPAWVNIVFTFEVLGGLGASIALLLQKKGAVILFTMSLLAVLIQTVYVYFLSPALATMGFAAIVMPAVAIVIGSGLLIFSKISVTKGWLV